MQKIQVSKFATKFKDQEYYALVDDSDYESLIKHTWSVHHKGNTSYAVTKVDGKQIKMHRMILGLTDPKIFTDHEDGNGLNNQKYNIRECSNSENQKNKIKKTGLSKYKGVTWITRRYKRKSKSTGEMIMHESSKWEATIKTTEKYVYLGRFINEIDAAKAYDAAAKIHHGEFAKLNFPGA